MAQFDLCLPGARHHGPGADALGGKTVAESRRALFRSRPACRDAIICRKEVRTELLSPTDTTSICPYKGRRYWTAEVEGQPL